MSDIQPHRKRSIGTFSTYMCRRILPTRDQTSEPIGLHPPHHSFIRLLHLTLGLDLLLITTCSLTWTLDHSSHCLFDSFYKKGWVWAEGYPRSSNEKKKDRGHASMFWGVLVVLHAKVKLSKSSIRSCFYPTFLLQCSSLVLVKIGFLCLWIYMYKLISRWHPNLKKP